MNTSRTLRSLLFLCAAATLVSPAAAMEHGKKTSHDHAMAEEKSPPKLVAVLEPTAGNDAHGVITFEALKDGRVKVTAEVEGLDPNATHAIHIHAYGDVRKEDGTAAGGHYNPAGVPHALPAEEVRHAGDLGNLKANASGKARYSLIVDNVSLAGRTHPIIGRSVIVHAKADDGGQPTGNAGPRIAQGVIGVANPDMSS